MADPRQLQIGAMELIPVGPLAGELILVGETDYLSSASAFLCRSTPMQAPSLWKRSSTLPRRGRQHH